MEKRSLLPISLLLASTNGVHQELCFQTQLPPTRLAKEACVVLLCLCDGTVRSCTIRDATSGTLLFQNAQAVELLKKLGMLEWYRVPPPAYDTQASDELPLSKWERSPLRPNGGLVPFRLGNADALPLFDHAHRRVLLLVDGKRNVKQIATLLGKPPEEVLAILHALQNANVLSF